jgi:hypothetical protein
VAVVLVLWMVFLVVSGLWLILRPEKAWRLRHLLSFRNPEQVQPSTVVLVYYRLSGVVCLGIVIWIAQFWLRNR